MEILESHPCVGCGANAKLTRKERGEHGGFYLTFTCLRCGTKEILKSGGEPGAFRKHDRAAPALARVPSTK